MSDPVNHIDQSNEALPQSTATPNWTIHVSDIITVKVSNLSLAASEMDIRDLLSISGDIHYIEMRKESETSQLAYVTFRDSRGADTAILLSGATVGDHLLTITLAGDYQLPPEAITSNLDQKQPETGSAIRKAEDVVSTMIAKGFVLGKDAINNAKNFDEHHHLTYNAFATVASIDRKMGLSEKLSIGTAIFNEKVREVDERFQVSEKTKSALAVAEQKASSTGSAIMNNRYVLTGASRVSSVFKAVTNTAAFSRVAKAAEEVSAMTREKVGKAEEDKKEILYIERKQVVNDFAGIHLDERPAEQPPMVTVDSSESKLGNI
ncbi:binding partner of ACD11 1-like isoform X1 [Tripterygium wilfordii]|uniref:binding partner of ACD11 1-like isoform X1 n=1 Tax=Tripterygium wilfordii TaxID=458696 RepID=UPI0018F83056|nr:binding partner of ACD11 1-like isoform X1 [Tripterygium wilfordii]